MQPLIPTTPSEWEPIKRLVLDGVSSRHSKRGYGAALSDFLGWYEAQRPRVFCKATVQAYRVRLECKGLSASSINIRLSAIRKLAAEASDNGLMQGELAAGIRRVRGAKKSGVRTGNWLTREQAEVLIEAPDCSTLKGKRDRALLAVLIAGQVAGTGDGRQASTRSRRGDCRRSGCPDRVHFRRE